MVPVPLGAVKEILIEDTSNTVAILIVGALDFVVTEAEVDDVDVPPELVAVTVNV